jgi:hypothetical protein
MIEDLTTRRLPDRNGRTSRIGLAALAATLLFAAPALAHSGEHSGIPSGYVPYRGGQGDPLGVTLSNHTQPKATIVADAAHGIKASNPLAAKVREMNARFADVEVAKAEGYAPIPCVSGTEGGAMGIHFVNGTLIGDEAIEIGKPEAVMYEPKADGSMELVAVEYLTTKGPANLDGHLFSFSGAPNRYGLPAFYELHVWAWRDNPTGTFADMNPNVSCAAALASAN